MRRRKDPPPNCAGCDEVPLWWYPSYRHGEVEPVLGLTHDRIRERVATGRLRLLRADCPLDRTLELFEAEAKYTLMTCLGCAECGTEIAWGLCVRGAPIWRKDATYVETWPWEPGPWFVDNVPDRPVRGRAT